jgi:antitoxin HicB
MKSTKFTVLVYENTKDEGGGFWATVAELPGCFTSGLTLQEIKENIQDAIETYVDAMMQTGDELPRPVFTKFEVPVNLEDLVARLTHVR